MDRKQRGLSIGVPTAVGSVVLAVSGMGWAAVVLALPSLGGFTYGFLPETWNSLPWVSPPKEVQLTVERDEDDWYLTVLNDANGITRRFRAKVHVEEGYGLRGARVGTADTLRWSSNDEIDTELFPGHRDRLLLATLETQLASGAGILEYDFPFGGSGGARSTTWTVGGPSDDQIAKPRIAFEVNLSAEPPLSDPATVYCVCDGDGLHAEIESHHS